MASTSTQVATTGSDHLDWRLLSTIGGVSRTLELYPYFVNVGGWNGAKDLDYISLYGWYQNVLYISAYVMNNGIRYEIASGDLVLYWRLAGNTAWNGPIALSRNADGNYTHNVANLASPGTSLDIIIRAKRTDQGTVPNYQYGWFPPKYNQPPIDPNAVDGTVSRSYIRVTVGSMSNFTILNQ